MAHTLKVIAAGVALLAVCLAIGRWVGGPTPSVSLVKAVKVFVPLWLVAAGFNMWVGVAKRGYSFVEEVPFFLIVFAVPTAVALLVWWRVARG